MITPLNREALRKQVESAEPFPHCVIENFLEPGFAREVHDAFPAYQDALSMGRVFKSVNEQKKVQITDAQKFAPPIQELNRLMSSAEWLDFVSYVFRIPKLLADDQLSGGGIHQTGPRGRLDVHIDFNYIPERQLHRRLNILVYFNQDWKAEWGGNLELWNKDVTQCSHSLLPEFNRCVIFETSEISYHGVTAVNCPPDRARKSFAAYYYTLEPPPHWKGEAHSTVFRSRPDERLKGHVLMPAEKIGRSIREKWYDARRAAGKLLKSRSD